MQAFLQVALDSAREQAIVDSLKKRQEVKEVHVLFGEWDLIAKLEVPNAEALGSFILENVRPLPGVRLTSTMIVAK